MGAVYKRILLKLSGEVLAGPKTTGIDNDTVVTICKSIKAVADLGVEVAIVVGGGNFWRKIQRRNGQSKSRSYRYAGNGNERAGALRRA